MAESGVGENQSGGPLFVRFTPLLAGLLAAIVALVTATLLGMPPPLDIAGVFLVIGLAAAWVARRTALQGAFFVAVIATIVLAVIYSA